MSATTAPAHGHARTEHSELGFVRTCIFSTDHKMIARQFLFLGLFMMIVGGLLALVVRWQLAWPETPVPGLGGILKETGGVLEPSAYNMAFTMHATIMIFFVVMPILIGAFGWPINFFWSLFAGQKASLNPWSANTLEWTAPSPPPHLNWGATVPTVYRGPYEYGSPESTEDWLPQTAPPGKGAPHPRRRPKSRAA